MNYVPGEEVQEQSLKSWRYYFGILLIIPAPSLLGVSAHFIVDTILYGGSYFWYEQHPFISNILSGFILILFSALPVLASLKLTRNFEKAKVLRIFFALFSWLVILVLNIFVFILLGYFIHPIG